MAEPVPTVATQCSAGALPDSNVAPARCRYCRSQWLVRKAGTVTFYCMTVYQSATDCWARSEECARFNGLTR